MNRFDESSCELATRIAILCHSSIQHARGRLRRLGAANGLVYESQSNTNDRRLFELAISAIRPNNFNCRLANNELNGFALARSRTISFEILL